MNHINPAIDDSLRHRDWEIKSLDYYVEGITNARDYYILSEAITLLESDHNEHRELSLNILKACYDHRKGKSFRIGVTGSPGVGKSTFIDNIAQYYAIETQSIGILTIDPSSIDGKGSILGDKTRMEELVKHKNIFIRPSPSNRHLGGLNQYTFEAIILCEAAGIQKIFIETVGTGQSEVEVSRYSDATILLVLPGSGDSIQGIKKGIVEKADLVIIHKSDGDAQTLAKASAKEYKEALHFKKDGKEIEVLNYSSLTSESQPEVIDAIKRLEEIQPAEFNQIRKKQETEWLKLRVLEFINQKINDEWVKQDYESHITETGMSMSPFSALSQLSQQIAISIKLKK